MRPFQKRKNFGAKVRKQAWLDACINGVPHCAICKQPIKGRCDYDHRHADALDCEALGFKIDSLENCQVLCVPCHKIKTVEVDRPLIDKADRLFRKHNGLFEGRGWK